MVEVDEVISMVVVVGSVVISTPIEAETEAEAVPVMLAGGREMYSWGLVASVVMVNCLL